MPPTVHDYSVEEWLPYRLWRLSRAAGDRLEAYYSRTFGLDGSDWRTLAILANYAPISAKALAEALDINQVQMTRALTRLQGLGLLSRRTDKNDKRKVVLQLNRKGNEIYQKIAPRAQAIEDQCFSGFSAGERSQFIAFLNRLEQQALS
ncbi:MAG: MarR family transcriptional regulator [Halieaceae bacterium]|jgi:DNA-binding MarR family transcriptional regulator|nr:MarR family transcriptional regulator [Halieaceae bacterium]